MISVEGLPCNDRKKVLEAVNKMPGMVEIITVPGFGDSYKGMLDKLPQGGPYYAVQGKLKMAFWKKGRFLTAE